MPGDTARTLERLLGRAKQHIRDAGSDDLGTREHEVLEGLADGLTVAAIAYRLDLSPATVDDHVAALYRKLGVRTRPEAIEAFLTTNPRRETCAANRLTRPAGHDSAGRATSKRGSRPARRSPSP